MLSVDDHPHFGAQAFNMAVSLLSEGTGADRAVCPRNWNAEYPHPEYRYRTYAAVSPYSSFFLNGPTI